MQRERIQGGVPPVSGYSGLFRGRVLQQTIFFLREKKAALVSGPHVMFQV